ncbi:MAG: hypothetical protein ACE5D7_00765, partial [Fidelibacterota bacterium]
YISMLRNNLNKGNSEKAFNNLDSIDNSLNSITDFTSNLSHKIVWEKNLIETLPNEYIVEVIRMCYQIIGKRDQDVIIELCAENLKLKTDTSIIRMLVMSWYAMNLRIFNSPEMTLKTEWNKENTKFTLSGSVIEKNGDMPDQERLRKSDSAVGVIPLITMKRIIHSNFEFADLIISRGDRNDFKLIISAL